MPQNPDFRFRVLKFIDVKQQHITVWRPASLSDVVPLIYSPTDPRTFVPKFDVDQFELPDPNKFRTTDIYSDDQVRAIRQQGDRYPLLVGENAEYVLFNGRMIENSEINGVALPRDTRFLVLQAYFDENVFRLEVESFRRVQKKKQQDENRQLRGKELGPYRGRTRL